MKCIIHCFIVSLLAIVLLSSAGQAFAVYDPLSVPNNKIGIHILFPDEINKAKDLVNSNNGSWGYVTIPIQAGDKDIKKWQSFMDESKKYRLIPIIRLATEGDYFDKTTWRKPKDSDVIDFANFLDSLNWPVKNRYIIVFNEVNRSDEWQGKADPKEYAEILSYAVTVFKSKNQDYFIISSGLDNGASTRNGTYNEYDYLSLMNDAVPGIFNQIDGFSSHSYPNAGFIQPPSVKTPHSITSFIYESQLVNNYSNKTLPVFITETGWDQSKVAESTVATYYKDALENVWNDPNIIAITPFLLKSGPGPFEKFSFIKNNGDKSEIFKTFESFPKIKGKPFINPAKKVLGDTEPKDLPVKNFSGEINNDGKHLKSFIKWMFFRF
ncbi:MAG: hypothetical protein AAB520_01120 [Patescibacteria group bacterium]